MNEKQYEHIIFKIRDDKAFLTINRPPMNILNISTMEEMNDALGSLAGNTEVKVLVVSSSGEKAFSAGVDVTDHTGDKVEKMLQVFHDVFRNLSKLDQVTVAALKGLTLGGGCELAVFCDLIFAANNLKIGQPEIRLCDRGWVKRRRWIGRGQACRTHRALEKLKQQRQYEPRQTHLAFHSPPHKL